MGIYKLTEQYLALLDMEDEDETVVRDTLESIEGEIEDKAENYAMLIKTLEGRAKVKETESERLASSAKADKNLAKLLKTNLQTCMEVTGKVKFKTNLFSFWIQNNNPSLKVDDPSKVDERFLIPQDPAIDNAGLKKFILDGGECDYAHIERGKGLRIR